jgi:predicted regulator of Ras-like GTPase activity (Roadblock/LC7/MglB family)
VNEEQPPVSLSASAKSLQATLEAFPSQVQGVTGAALGTADGLLVSATAGLERDHAEELAAVACGLVSIVGGGSARVFGEDRVELAVAQLTRWVLVVKPLRDGSIVAVVAQADVDTDAIGTATVSLGRRISEVLTPQVREELQDSLVM